MLFMFELNFANTEREALPAPAFFSFFSLAAGAFIAISVILSGSPAFSQDIARLRLPAYFMAGGNFDDSTIAVLIDRKKYRADIEIISSGSVLPPEGEKLLCSRVRLGGSRKSPVLKFPGLASVAADDEGYSLINYLTVREYIASVLISELETQNPDMLRALAVLVRTLVLKEINKRSSGEAGARHPGGAGFLICARTHCASYRGIVSERSYLKALSAVKDVSGMALLCDGSPVEVFYSASCGGNITRASEIYHSISGDAYFENKPCVCAAEARRWRNIYPAAELSRLFGFKIYSIEAQHSPYFIIINKKIKITFDSFISKIEKSGLVRLKSPFFEASYDRDRGAFVFNGLGIGHSAGLCIHGASIIQKRGGDYKKILNYYYKSCNLKSVDL